MLFLNHVLGIAPRDTLESSVIQAARRPYQTSTNMPSILVTRRCRVSVRSAYDYEA
jgi:hypothetical protein